MERFTTKEIDTLIEALECYESHGRGGNPTMFAALISGMISEEDLKSRFEQETAKAKANYEADLRQRKEIATLLKAKLIMLKQSMAIEQATKHHSGSGPDPNAL